MTRFARAKGSKSSNERAPEDSTPWEIMKEQLLQAKKQNSDAIKREEAEKQRIENYENFLKEHKVQKRKAAWCDFPDAEEKKQNKHQTSVPLIKNKKKHKQANNHTENSESITAETKGPNIMINNNHNSSEKKLKKKKVKHTPETPTETLSEPNINLLPTEKNKKKKNKKNNQQKNNNSETKSDIQDNINVCVDENKNNTNNSIQNKKSKNKKRLFNGEPVRRKPINDHSFQLIINGKEVELIRFDGFPIMKKDAERLNELKTNMIKKGIPKSEVQRTLKLERRRAEKALARLKRDVCYNCRKGGHNLSDCPELKSKIPGADVAEGVCFKCGSTEHRQFECKVQRDNEFRFATCFICREPGHIARQCPDNPKGLYPNGGGCKLCGDVTHLRKDCPTVMDKKQETSFKLQTLDGGENLEGIDQQMKKTILEESSKKPKKIKF